MTSKCPYQSLNKKWFENENSVWLFSTFELRRNLKTHSFPSKLASKTKEKMAQMLADACTALPSFKQAHCVSIKDLKPEQKRFLFEYYASNQDFSPYHQGELLILDAQQPFYMGLQLQDHIQLHWIDTKNEIEESWTQLLHIEKELSKNFEFAFHPRFGFLTADPKQCAMGLTVSMHLHLPALFYTKQLDSLLQKVNPHFFEMVSLGKQGNEALGDLFTLKNKHTLSITEENLLKNMRRVAIELSLEEQKKRKQLSESETNLLQDKLGKAFGVLKHASRLSIEEALKSLSLCKLALELGWLKGISHKKMNALLFTSRKPFLNQENSTSKDIEELRADFLKDELKKAKLQLN